jgi:acetyl-CoA carboxylase carboxyltransferase component
MGGEVAVDKHHGRGKLTLRERIDSLLDPASFREVGRIAGGSVVGAGGALEEFTPANFLLGTGKIGSRPAVVGGEDFTISGGSPTAAGYRKSVYAETLALQYQIPLVRLHEGGGGSVSGGARAGKGGAPPPPTGDPVFARPRFESVAKCLATVPVATAALGPVAGLPASRLVASHFSVMAEHAQVLTAGPKVVARALGYEITKEELGGVAVHSQSGVVDNIVGTEHEALEQIRRFLSYLPPNVNELPPVVGCPSDPSDRMEAALSAIVPANRREAFDMRAVFELVFDREAPTPAGAAAPGSAPPAPPAVDGSDGLRSSFFEIGSGTEFGRTQITGLARLNGQPVGVFGNDCRFFAGAMTWDASLKVKRFLELCQTFHLPIVSFVDEPGFMIGLEAEAAGTIRHGTAVVLTAQTCTVPWASVHVRKAYGVAAAAHYGPEAHVLAWPSAETGALPVESGVAVAFSRELEALARSEGQPAADAKRAELERRFSEGLSPFPRAESFAVHDLIDPRETRPALCGWLELARLKLPALVGPTGFAYRP